MNKKRMSMFGLRPRQEAIDAIASWFGARARARGMDETGTQTGGGIIKDFGKDWVKGKVYDDVARETVDMVESAGKGIGDRASAKVDRFRENIHSKKDPNLFVVAYKLLGGLVARIPGPFVMLGGVGAALYVSSTFMSFAIDVVTSIVTLESKFWFTFYIVIASLLTLLAVIVVGWWAFLLPVAAVGMTYLFYGLRDVRDIGFALTYSFAAVGVIIGLALITLVAEIPVWAIFGIAASTVGVWMSVMMDMVMTKASLVDEFGDTDSDEKARRRMYLHGGVGMGVALIIIAMQIIVS